MRKPRLMLAGYFGCGNIGDEAVLTGLLTGLQKLNVEPIVLADSKSLTLLDFNLKSVPRKSLKHIYHEMRSCDGLILGGGSLLQDVTSTKSLLYYLTLIQLARMLKKKVALTGQGIGPIIKPSNKRLIAKALSSAEFVAVRDEESLIMLTEMGVKSKLYLTADMAWLMPTISVRPREPRRVGFAIRPWSAVSEKDLISIFEKFYAQLSLDGYMPEGIAMDNRVDKPFLNRIKGAGINSVITSPKDAMTEISRFVALVAMRYHGVLLAAKSGTPTIAISYDPKVSSLAKCLEIPHIELGKLSYDTLFAAWEALVNDTEEKTSKLQGNVDRLTNLALINIDLIQENFLQ